MLPTLARACATAGLLVLAATFAVAAPAAAADTTITLDIEDGEAFLDEPLAVSGTCTDGSTTAVVTVLQNGEVVAEEAADVVDDAYAVTLDISDADVFFAVAAVDCLSYADGEPLGSAAESFFVYEDFELIDVTVSPSRVRIGGQLTATAQCPAGSSIARLRVFNVTDANFADEPPVLVSVQPAPDGLVSYTGRVTPREDLVPGPAGLVVTCGEDEVSFGFADLTLLAAAPASATPDSPADNAPELALTGSATGPLTATAIVAILIGVFLMLVGVGLPKRLRRPAESPTQ